MGVTSGPALSVIAKASWLSGGEYWATFRVSLTNYSAEDVFDPRIYVGLAEPQIIKNNYGLIFVESDEKVECVEGRLVLEKRLLAANGGSQEFTLSVQNGGAGAGVNPELLPDDFKVNGNDANPPEDNIPPSVPTDLHVTGSGPHSVTLAWTRSTDNIAVAGYEVMVSSPTRSRPRTTLTTGTTVSGLRPLTEYAFLVRAFDISGNYSDWSTRVQAVTTEPLPDGGTWRVPRSPFVDYTAFPSPQLTEYHRLCGMDGFFTGFLVCVPGRQARSPRSLGADNEVYWGGFTVYPATGDFGKEDFAEFIALGGQVVLSFGGASNEPLEAVETDVSKIVASYHAILDNHSNIWNLDFDFEGGFIHNGPGQERHVAAISQILQERPGLQISYTLPVDGQPNILEGFNDGGVALLHLLADAGIQPSLLQGMLMEFGAQAPADLFEACVVALNGMHRQISAAWPEWDAAKVWRRIGACPMYGRHNNGDEFTLENMRQLLAFAQEHTIGCLSGWDATRDHNQGFLELCDNPGGNDVSKCTYTPQEQFDFCKIIMEYRPDLSAAV
jgi:hypothetical protein